MLFWLLNYPWSNCPPSSPPNAKSIEIPKPENTLLQKSTKTRYFSSLSAPHSSKARPLHNVRGRPETQFISSAPSLFFATLHGPGLAPFGHQPCSHQFEQGVRKLRNFGVGVGGLFGRVRFDPVAVQSRTSSVSLRRLMAPDRAVGRKVTGPKVGEGTK